MRVMLCAGALLTISGCNKNGGKESAYVEQKREPLVAVVPVFDRTENAGVSWSLSDEITAGLRRTLAKNEKLTLTQQKQVHVMTQTFTGKKDPFATDISWVKQSFPCCQFVVFTEILEHEEVPVSPRNAQNSPANLNMSVKLRVVDNRGQTARVILQEIVHQAYPLAKQFTRENFRQIPWGKENYHVSPVGMAHANLIQELAGRVEDYVLLAIRG